MRFLGYFECTKCGKPFNIELGPVFMGEQKTPQKIGKSIGALSVMFAQSCLDHESECTEGKSPIAGS